MVRSLLRNRFLASCWVIVEPPCTTPPACALVTQRAEGAGEVDAEMLVEAPVLGRQRRLDQMVGNSSSGTESLCLMPRLPISLP
jgi:hypothetical protein